MPLHAGSRHARAAADARLRLGPALLLVLVELEGGQPRVAVPAQPQLEHARRTVVVRLPSLEAHFAASVAAIDDTIGALALAVGAAQLGGGDKLAAGRARDAGPAAAVRVLLQLSGRQPHVAAPVRAGPRRVHLRVVPLERASLDLDVAQRAAAAPTARDHVHREVGRRNVFAA